MEHEAKRPKGPVVSWTFADDYPLVGGKSITVRRPTAAEERDILASQDASMTGVAMEVAQGKTTDRSAADVRIDIAQRCVVSFDDKDLKDSVRDDVWEDELDGWARSDLLQWVAYCMVPTALDGGERKPPFLR